MNMEAERITEGQEQIPHELPVAHSLRQRSSVWKHFTHFTANDGKSRAECKHCHRVFVATTRNGTSTLRRHVTKCKRTGGSEAEDLSQWIASLATDVPLLPSDLPCDPSLTLPYDPSPRLPCDPPLLLPFDLPPMLPCDPSLTLPYVPPPTLPCDRPPTLPCDPPPQLPCDPPSPLPCTDPPLLLPYVPSHSDNELPDREQYLEDKEANKLLAQLIALHGYDPALIEDNYFRSFVGSLNSELKLPSRLTIEDMCDGIFDEARKDLLSRLSCSHGKVSLAVATTKTTHGEVLYTVCHFIDDEWELHKMVLDAYLVAPFPFFYGPLLGVPEVTLDWAAADVLGGILQYNDILDRLFVLVLATKDSEKIKRYMKQIVSLDFTYHMDIALHSIAERSIVLDQNFTAKIYEKLHGLDLTREKRLQIFSHIGLDHLRAFDYYWYSCYCSLEFLRKHGSCTIADTDYSQLVELLCKVWGGIYSAIQRISTSNYPTQCLGELFKVREILESELERADGHRSFGYNNGSNVFLYGGNIADVLRGAKDRVDTAIQGSYLVWSVPLVLDPRYKLTYVKFIFSRAFGSGAARYIFEITRKMKKLYADYVEYDGGTNGVDSDGITETAAGSSADPLGQAWDEHCRAGDGTADVGTHLDTEEELYRSLEDLVIGTASGSSTDPLGQAWDKHCHSEDDGRTDAGSYLDAEKELDRYLKDPREIPTEGFDILNWWKENSRKYPTVAQMARDVLAMPIYRKLSSEQMAHVSSIVRGYSKKKYRQSKYER